MFNHCLCDDTSSSQFLHAWAKLIREPNTELTMVLFHGWHMLKPWDPPQVHFSHLGYTRTNPAFQDELLLKMMMMMMMQSQSEPLVVTLFTFGASDVVWLKQQCVPEIIVKLPKGYYGNGFVLACAEIIVKDLVAVNLRHGLEVVNEAKASLDDEEYIRSIWLICWRTKQCVLIFVRVWLSRSGWG